MHIILFLYTRNLKYLASFQYASRSWEYPDDLYHEVFDHVHGEVGAWRGPQPLAPWRARDLPGPKHWVPAQLLDYYNTF